MYSGITGSIRVVQVNSQLEESFLNAQEYNDSKL